MRFPSSKLSVVLLVGCLVVAILWARRADPWIRQEFTLTLTSGKSIRGLVVRPSLPARYPVVVVWDTSNPTPWESGSKLRALAQSGCAAISLHVPGENRAEAWKALHALLQRRDWALPDHCATIDLEEAGNQSLARKFDYGLPTPQLSLWISGQAPLSAFWEESAKGSAVPSPTHPCLMLVPSPMPAAARVAQARDLGITLRVWEGAGSTNQALQWRRVAECCQAAIGLPDYVSHLGAGLLSQEEQAAVNDSLHRAGMNRKALWQGIHSFSGEKRRLAMMMVSHLEDYDLARYSTSLLQDGVNTAWNARVSRPWCRKMPREVFEKFVATPRGLMEPVEAWPWRFQWEMEQSAKYARTSAEASDAAWNWMLGKVRYQWAYRAKKNGTSIVADGLVGSCEPMVMLYTRAARGAGVATRPLHIVWQSVEAGDFHLASEVWHSETDAWVGVDSSVENRPFAFDWLRRVPKVCLYTPTGERGYWNAFQERRFEDLVNVTALLYPSGAIQVKVHGPTTTSVPERVVVEHLGKNGFLPVASGWTDARGEVGFTLGEFPQTPYRVLLAGAEDRDWAWVFVRTNQTVSVDLERDRRKPFSASLYPTTKTLREKATP